MGTINVAMNPPVEFVTIDEGLVVMDVLSNVIAIEWFGVNAFAFRVTLVPAVPDVGLAIMFVTRYIAIRVVFELIEISLWFSVLPVSCQ